MPRYFLLYALTHIIMLRILPTVQTCIYSLFYIHSQILYAKDTPYYTCTHTSHYAKGTPYYTCTPNIHYAKDTPYSTCIHIIIMSRILYILSQILYAKYTPYYSYTHLYIMPRVLHTIHVLPHTLC